MILLKRSLLSLVFLLCLSAYGRSLCSYYLLEDDDRTLQVKVDYDGRIVHGRIIDHLHPEETIRALFLGRVSSDGTTFISDARDTQLSDQRRGFQRILTQEVAKAFPHISRLQATLQDDNALSFFRAIQLELGVPSAKALKTTEVKEVAKQVHKLIEGLSPEKKKQILFKAAMATPDAKLADELLGYSKRPFKVVLDIDPETGNYNLEVDFVSYLWN